MFPPRERLLKYAVSRTKEHSEFVQCRSRISRAIELVIEPGRLKAPLEIDVGNGRPRTDGFEYSFCTEHARLHGGMAALHFKHVQEASVVSDQRATRKR